MKSLQLFSSEQGQMIAELIVVIPAFMLVLAITSAAFMFLSESARLERIANEVAREITQSSEDPLRGGASTIAARSFGRPNRTRLNVYLSVYNDPMSANNSRRRCEAIIEFTPFTFKLLKSNKKFTPIKIVKKKRFYTTTWNPGVLP